MKCPICKSEMEKGLLGSGGVRWQKGVGITGGKILETVSGPLVVAYKCPKCGKMELTTEEKIN